VPPAAIVRIAVKSWSCGAVFSSTPLAPHSSAAASTSSSADPV
jgi:hypothetical protein